jgi:glycosyltransferase involved in cell wall biosynthesis
MRRVVVNGRFFAQQRTGVQRYATETLRALDRLLSERPQYLQRTAWQLAVPHDAGELPLLENFEIQLLQFLRGHWWEQVSLAAFARGAYLINLNYSAPLGKRDQLITVHDAAVRAYPAAYSHGYRMLSQLMVSALAPRVDRVMTVSRFAASELRLRFHLSRDDVLVGREGWEHVRDAPSVDDSAVLHRHGLVSGQYLLAVGSPKATKNFGLIPRALRLLAGAQVPPVAVAGACDARVYASGAESSDSSLRWLGFVPDPELNALYRHAAWFIFPSLYEGFGLPPLEAMANGCPVLAAAGPLVEIYGDAVLYFDPHDPAALAALLRDVLFGAGAAARRDALKGRARTCLADYRWQINAEILLDHLIAAGVVADGGGQATPTAQALEPWLPTVSP